MVASRRKREEDAFLFSGKKTRVVKKSSFSECTFLESACLFLVEKTQKGRRRRRRNSTCKIEREPERERKKRRKRERILTSSEPKNVRPNHAGFVFQRHARVSRCRWHDDGTFIVSRFFFPLIKIFSTRKKREGSEGKRKNNFHFGPSVVTQLFGELFFSLLSLPIIFRKQRRQKRTDDALRRALVNFVLTCTFC